MKKRLLTIVLSVLMCALCFIPSATAAAGDVTLYLVLGKGATLDGTAGANNSTLFLENCKEFTAQPGTTLPTPVRGEYRFNGWVYAVDGAIHKVDTVPSAPFIHENDDAAILYAMWSNDEVPDPEPVETSLVLYMSTAAGVFDNNYKLTRGWSDFEGGYEYSATVTVEAGFTFKLRAPTPIANASGTEYPNRTQSSAEAVGYKLKVGGSNDTADHLTVIDNGNEIPKASLAADGSDKKYVYASGEGGELRFKQTGTYTVYFAVWANGGWVNIYCQPA